MKKFKTSLRELDYWASLMPDQSKIFLILLVLTLIAPLWVKIEEQRALHNISINKNIEFDYATADFYKNLCSERDLNTKTCQDAQKILENYKNQPEKVKILGF